MRQVTNARESRRSEIRKLDHALGRLIQILEDQEDRISRLESILDERPPEARREAREPSNGRELYGWAMDRGVADWFSSFGDSAGLPSMIHNWAPDEVEYAMKEYRREYREYHRECHRQANGER
jgi:hypothetical protein